MIEGFAFQVNNFEKPNAVTTKNGSTNAEIGSKFNDILESRGNLFNSTNEKTTQESNQKENDFLTNQNAVLSRKLDIRYEEQDTRQITKDSKQKSSDKSAIEKEKSVDELVENLQGIITVLQNVVAISDMDLKNISLEDINVEVSVEELESLKLSLENLANTVDLGEEKEKIILMVEKLGSMISEAKINGEIEVSAEEFGLELQEIIEIVDQNLSEKTIGEVINSKEITSPVKELVNSIGQLNDKIAIKESLDASKDTTEIEELKEMVEEIVDVLKSLNDKTNQVREGSESASSNVDSENISAKLESLLKRLEQTQNQGITDKEIINEETEAIETSDLRQDIKDVVEVIESLNTKTEQVAEEITVKVEDLITKLNSQSLKHTTEETTEIKDTLTEILEVIDILNRSSENQNAEVVKAIDTKLDNMLNRLEKLSNAFSSDKDIKSIEDHIVIMDSDLTKGNIKLRVVTDKTATDEPEDLEVLQEASQPISEVSQEFISSIENQAKISSNTSKNLEKTSELVKSQQFIDIDKNDVIKQITSKVKSDYESQLNEIKISLTPEHLGELMIKISLERGILSARALVENTNIKQLLESNLNDLKENLREQGLKFNSIDVSVGSDSEFEEKRPEFFMNQEMSKRQNRRLKSSTDNLVSENYYGELNEKSISQSLNVGEGSLDITV